MELPGYKPMSERKRLKMEAIRLGYVYNKGDYNKIDIAGWKAIIRSFNHPTMDDLVHPGADEVLNMDGERGNTARPLIGGEYDRNASTGSKGVSFILDIDGVEITGESIAYILKYAEDKFIEVMKSLSGKGIDKIQITLSNFGTEGISTSYAPYSEAWADFNEKLLKIVNNYGDGSKTAYRLTFNYYSNIDVRGMYRQITSANQKWLMLDTSSRENCVYNSVYTLLNWKKKPELLTDKKARSAGGSKLKNNKSNKFVDAPDYEAICKMAKWLSITLNVYNNIYEYLYVINAGCAQYDICIYDRHAIPMILLSEIKVHAPAYVIPCCEYTPSVKDCDNVKIRPTACSQQINMKIAAWDLETYLIDVKNTSRLQGADKQFVVYCSGIAFIDGDDTVFEQIYGDVNNLKHFMDYIKRNIVKLSGYTLYAHNGGKFDLILLMRDQLLTDNTITIVPSKLVELNSAIIGLTIKYNGHLIHFKDSFRMLQGSLYSVSRDMGVETVKGSLDHNKINKDTYMDHMSEVVSYHKDDCLSLLECMTKLAVMTFDSFAINITDCYTAASLSKKAYKCNYLKNINSYIYRLKNEIEVFVRESYSGGRCEVFALGDRKNVYYYDFTSLYPYHCTRLLPCGLPEWVNVEDLTIKRLLLRHPMSFIECEVTGTKEMLCGRLPLHGVKINGKLVFPYIETPKVMTLFSHEIKKGITCGYKYIPLRIVRFDSRYILRDFVLKGFEMKRAAKAAGHDALCMMYKVVLNSIYGVWGYNPYNKNAIKLYRNGRGWLSYYDKNRLLAVGKQGNYTLARVVNDVYPTDSNVAISAAISSYARINLWELMNDIQSRGGKLYYCDTDSLACDFELSSDAELMKKYRPDGLGVGLGSVRNELGLDAFDCDMCFDSMTVVGCKMYSVYGTDDFGKRVEIDHLKGYAKDACLHENLMKMADGGVVTQSQMSFQINKSDYLRTGSGFNIRSCSILKSFQSGYDKGTVITSNGETVIVPLVI